MCEEANENDEILESLVPHTFQISVSELQSRWEIYLGENPKLNILPKILLFYSNSLLCCVNEVALANQLAYTLAVEKETTVGSL